MKSYFSSYKGVRNIFRRYWDVYGGRSALFRSPYFQLSAVLAAVMFPAWLPSWADSKWWELVISIMPNVLGFSLGGYAIWLGFGSEKFMAFLCAKEETEERSVYIHASSTFLHFIILQVLALLTALIARSMFFTVDETNVLVVKLGRIGVDAYNIFWIMAHIGCFVGYWLFIYSLLAALAAAMAVFRVSSWYDIYQNENKLEPTTEDLLKKIVDILEKK
ncbi:MAG: hypothetical protein IH588_18845 [Anaerolineales bacterium]|nr:hypothetical protein [Anaerolineales bacterium]